MPRTLFKALHPRQTLDFSYVLQGFVNAPCAALEAALAAAEAAA